MDTNYGEQHEIKKLFLSSTDKRLAGVCGGIAEYFEIDPALVRLAWIIMTLTSGILPGIVAYIAAIIIMPKAHEITEQTILHTKHAV